MREDNKFQNNNSIMGNEKGIELFYFMYNKFQSCISNSCE